MCRINHFPQGWCLHVNFCTHVNTNQDGCHWHTANIHRAPEKNVHLNDFWHGKSWENLTKILQICPPHLSDVATLPWEIQKCHFQQYYSYTLLVMLSQKETNCNPLAHVTTLTCELQDFYVWNLLARWVICYLLLSVRFSYPAVKSFLCFAKIFICIKVYISATEVNWWLQTE